MVPHKSPRFRGTGAGQHRWIKPIQIHGEVDRLAPEGLQGLHQLLDCHQSTRCPQLAELLAGATADGDLEQLLAGQHLQAAAHGAGVAVLGAKPFVAQVGMGIKLHQHQIGMLRRHRRHGARTDRMFAAQH